MLICLRIVHSIMLAVMKSASIIILKNLIIPQKFFVLIHYVGSNEFSKYYLPKDLINTKKIVLAEEKPKINET